MRTLITFVFLAAALPVVWGQKNTRPAEVSFYAKVDRPEIQLGEAVEVTFHIENATGNHFTPPDWQAAGLAVVSTAQSSSTSVGGGKVRSTLVYSYAVVPQTSGEVTIPAALLRGDAGERQTAPLTVRVNPAPDGTSTLPSSPGRRERAAPPPPAKKLNSIRI